MFTTCRYLLFGLLIGTGLALPAQEVYVLGTAQDAGYPQLACERACCRRTEADPAARRSVVALAIADARAGQWYLCEATPDIEQQLRLFRRLTGGRYPFLPAGILLTHAHMGHYAGLLELGRESVSTRDLPVYALPRLADFLRENGPWSQLVRLRNIELRTLTPDVPVTLGEGLTATALPVPHRDEFSETAGFRIAGPDRSLLFLPDIDKWEKWTRDIRQEVGRVDLAFLDATFFSADELPNRDLAEIPHPLVTETMALFQEAPSGERAKIHFIHCNHSNPLLWDERTRQAVQAAGFRVAEEGRGWVER
jgi:pyrroloquinoline quinone biosynthesis protein B